jgi:hypothetical protein
MLIEYLKITYKIDYFHLCLMDRNVLSQILHLLEQVPTTTPGALL